MKNITAVVSRLFILSVFTAILAVCADAQLTVINTASTDTLQAKMFYIEIDALGKPVAYRKGGFQSYGYRTVYGLNRKTEVGVSFFYTRNGTQPMEMQFSAKRKLFSKEKWGVASSAGVTAFVPLNISAGRRTFFLTYANFSKTVRRLNGLRITAGAYHIANVNRSFGARTGATLAIEQPLTKRLNFVGDWSSGRNRFGYAAAGFSLLTRKNQSATFSYNFGNTGRGNNYFLFFYSIIF